MRKSGFTVIEIITVLGISIVLISALLRYLVAGYPISRTTYLQQRSTEDAQLQLKRMSKQMREIRPADTGDYPLTEMSPQRMIFFANIDDDPETERVRYELSGSDLVRGITNPTGDPLEYDVANNEIVTIVSRYIRNGSDPIFTYYSGDYPEDATPLAPTDLTEVKYVEFDLVVDADTEQDPPAVVVQSQVQLRNLKTNLGQEVE